MPTKKPTAKQLAARKKFAEMAKSGELAKKRVSTTKKKKIDKPAFDQNRIDMIAGKLLNSELTASTFTISKAKSKMKNVVLPLYVAKMIDAYSKEIKESMRRMSKGLKKPVTKGLTTLCAKTVGVDGRRKKDGTVKKNHVVKKGGKVVAVKKKTAVKKK